MKKGMLLAFLLLPCLGLHAQQHTVQTTAPVLQAPVQAVPQPPATGTQWQSTTSNAVQGNAPVSAQTPALPATTQATKPAIERPHGKKDAAQDEKH
jgi:hypothetical protein